MAPPPADPGAGGHLPIGPTAGSDADAESCRRSPKGEVCGGREKAPQPPLQQTQRAERDRKRDP